MTTTLPGHDGGVSGASSEASSPDATTPSVPLLRPRDGVPPVIETDAALTEAIDRFAGGSGPVAVDAERASGYRYSQRAYLVQLRRAGAGTAMIDPIACPDLSGLAAALGDAEWVLHAASQDLSCLAEVGLVPPRIFDTELAGRLAGFERVGLGAMVETVLGLSLEKGHSAADWSTRPLPDAWLVYAALDVEVLVELRDALEADLSAQGKLAWAHEEFDVVLHAPPPTARTDPWRRTSGIHRLRSRRQLAGVRALWEVRDAMARRRDIAPGRILPDAAIISAVVAAPATTADLLALPVFGGRATRRHVDAWFGALAQAAALPEDALPLPVPVGDGPPPANRWAERDPVAARRLARVRAALTSLAIQHRMPPENLLQPDSVRRLAWQPPVSPDAAAVGAALTRYGARPWQVTLTAEAVAAALPEPEVALPEPEVAAFTEPEAAALPEPNAAGPPAAATGPICAPSDEAPKGTPVLPISFVADPQHESDG